MNYLVVAIIIIISIAIVVTIGYFLVPTTEILPILPILPIISYEKQKENSWDGSSVKEYTCPNGKNVNLKGNNNDYANYCIFDTEKDVKEWCDNDEKCIGYVNVDGDVKFQAVTKTKPNSYNKMFFYKKTVI